MERGKNHLKKKLALIGLAISVTLIAAAVAIAQVAPQLTITEAKLTPASGGTAKKPKNGSANVSFTVNRDANVTADQIVFLLPKNFKLSGDGFKYCPASKINNGGTIDDCPTGSKVGSGSAVAYAGSTRIDYVISIFAASKNSIMMYLDGNVTVPALEGIISKAGSTDAGGGLTFGQKITIDIPEQVQKPIPGLYSAITEVKAKLGPATGKKKVTKKVRVRGKLVKKRVTVKTFFAGVNGCPSDDKTHDFGVRLRYVPNPNPPSQGGSEAYVEGSCAG